MSTKTQFPNEAVEVLTREIHDPCFFNKLASDWNIIPRSNEERSQLLELATVLRSTQDAQVKTAASASNSFLTGALDSLKGALQDRGYQTTPTTEVQAIKYAAAQAARHPTIADAALKYAQHMFASVE